MEAYARDLEKSATLSRYQVPNAIPLHDVIRVLNKAKINFVLVGAHGLAGWIKKPRATQDVDVVVAAKQVKKAVTALLDTFPHLEPVDLAFVVRLRDRKSQDVLIDVMKPLQQPYKEALKHTRMVTSEGESFRIPELEMAIVMKFSAMISTYRAEADKYQDAHDFLYMVKANPQIDQEKLSALASMIYPDGGKYALELVRKAQAGEKLVF